MRIEDIFPVFEPPPPPAESANRAVERLHAKGFFTFELSLTEASTNIGDDRGDTCLCVLKLPEVARGRALKGNFLDVVSLLRSRTAKNDTLVLYEHGNAESVHTSDASARFVSEKLGCVMLAHEWQGYGFDRTRPPRIEAQIVRCAKLLHELLSVEFPTILMGYSLGSAILLAAVDRTTKRVNERDDIGVVLLAPFVDPVQLVCPVPILADVASKIIPIMDNGARIRNLHRPLLLVHGKNDVIIPHRHSRDLADAFVAVNANRNMWARRILLSNAGHCDLLDDFGNGSKIASAVRELIRIIK